MNYKISISAGTNESLNLKNIILINYIVVFRKVDCYNLKEKC